MNKHLLLLLFNPLSFIFILNYAIGQDFSFYKENITMKIEDGSFYVSGTYYLKGESGSSTVLIYPFPEDTSYGDADSLYIFNLNTNEAITPLKQDKKQAAIKVNFGGSDTIALQISYHQKLLGKKAEYILKSTISWRKPLEQANYQLIIPENIEILSFTIPPGDSLKTDHEKIYYWEKLNYMPTDNMIFEFRVR